MWRTSFSRRWVNVERRVGIPELIIILFIIVKIFGASRLPEIGRGIGKGIADAMQAKFTSLGGTALRDSFDPATTSDWRNFLNKFKDAGGAFTISHLAHNYAGSNAPQSAIDSYITDWCRLADTPLTPQSTIHLDNDAEMLNLARAVFKHESRSIVKISNDQILFAIQKQRTNAMPPPPKPP